jgi:hypothetical protein
MTNCRKGCRHANFCRLQLQEQFETVAIAG